MRLVLASQGFTTPQIAQITADLAGKPLNDLNVAIINEAYVGAGAGRDQKWLINELSWISQYAKGVIAFVNIRAYDLTEVKKRLEFADVIYIVGGKQIVLPKLFKQTGFDDVLKEMAEQKVVIGTSAGGNVLGRQIEDPRYWEDQYGSSEEFLAASPLGLVGFNTLPHFEREDHPRRNAEVLGPLLKNNPFPLYGICDTQAVVYNDGKVSFVGGDPIVFGEH